MLRVCARNLQSLTLRRNVKSICPVTRVFCEKITKDETEPSENLENNKLGGFAKAFEKYTQPQKEEHIDEKLPDLPFATLLRNSNLIDVSKTYKH